MLVHVDECGIVEVGWKEEGGIWWESEWMYY